MTYLQEEDIMISCHGCGAIKQIVDINKEGYTKNLDNEFCERCFRIKHYNDYKKIEKSNEDFFPVIEEIRETNDLVVLLVDLLNVPKNLGELISAFNNPILLVLSKRDLLPVSLYEDRIIDYFSLYGRKIVDIMIISSAKNYHLDDLLLKIKKNQKSKNVYVVGYTNAGKSTLINKIISNYTKERPIITTSILPSTTIEKIEIEIDDDLILIDTPGLIEDGSIIQFVDEESLKKIVPKKVIKPITYQIKEKQYILLDDFAYVVLECENDITLYMSNELEIKRVWNQPEETKFEERTFSIKRKEDIVIAGLGFIKVMKPAEVTVYTFKEVDVYTRKTLI